MRNKTQQIKPQQGFTLIELLVVIAIIGLISSIILYNLAVARQKGRDTKRIADMQQIDTAIQIYIQDNGHAPYLSGQDTIDLGPPQLDGAYNSEGLIKTAQGAPLPVYTIDCSASNPGPCYANDLDWGVFATELSPYISKLPKDPCGSACGAGYTYLSPAYEAYLCNQVNCGLSINELNTNYAIYNPLMELQNPEGFNHGVGDSF